GDGVDGVLGEFEDHAFGRQERHVLLDQRGLGLGQDAAEVVARQRRELDADRQAALQFRQQVRRLGNVKGAGRDEQNVVGLHRPVLGVDGGALDQRQEVALHALARHVAGHAAVARADLVDLVEEDDAVLLDGADRFLHQRVAVEQLVALLGDQDIVRFLDGDAPRLGAAAAELAENVADGNGADLRARHAGDFEHRHAGGALGDLNLDLLVVDLAGAQLLAVAFARQRDRDFDEVAYDLLDVAADIADFGELGGLDLEERRAGELRQPPG